MTGSEVTEGGEGRGAKLQRDERSGRRNYRLRKGQEVELQGKRSGES